MEQIKSGYNKTEVGVIPEDWVTIKLVDLAEIATGNTPPTNDKTNYGDEFFFVSPVDLGKGKWILNTEKKLSLKGFDISRKFPKYSILFTCIGSTIGKSGISNKELTSNQQINAVFPNSNYDTDYLYYALEVQSKKIKSLAGEQAVPLINKTEFGLTKIPLPPTLKEQKAIADALSDVDALIGNLEKLIAKKKAIKQGAMQQLLTPPHKGGKRLEGFSGEWKEVKLGDLGSTYGGLSGKTKNDFVDGKYPYITFLNVMNNTVIEKSEFGFVSISNSERQNLTKYGDLFFNTSSETPEEVGMCAVLLDNIPNLYLNSFCFGFRLNNLNDLDGLFLSYYFNSPTGRKHFLSLAQGATRYNLSKTNFNQIEFYLPGIKEQKAIAAIMHDIDTDLDLLNRKLHKSQMIKQGMMQELLTGKTRLV